MKYYAVIVATRKDYHKWLETESRTSDFAKHAKKVFNTGLSMMLHGFARIVGTIAQMACTAKQSLFQVAKTTTVAVNLDGKIRNKEIL